MSLFSIIASLQTNVVLREKLAALEAQAVTLRDEITQLQTRNGKLQLENSTLHAENEKLKAQRKAHGDGRDQPIGPHSWMA